MEDAPRVGRKPQKSVSQQILVYKECKDELLENGCVKPASREIYDTLCKRLDMTRKAINLSIIRNSELIFGQKYTNRKCESEVEENEETSDDDWSSDSWITINLSDTEQKMFRSFEKQYSDRNRQVLPRDWANNLNAIIVRETKTECCINFVRGEIVANEIEAEGYCAECKGIIRVKSFNSRQNMKIKIIAGTEEHTFTKKRRVTHGQKKELEEKLKTTYPSNVLNELADQKPLLEHESRDIPSKSALKSIRHNVLNKSKLDSNCINALRKMKYLPEFEGAIKEISTDPLRVIFWTKYQEMWYNNYACNEKSTICIDATGSIVTSANLLSGLGLDHIKLPHIFLYLIVAITAEGVSVPVAQFLSADQRSIAISYFLQSWLIAVKKPPKEIIIYDSAALLKSCVLSFTSCESVKGYIQRCFTILNGSENSLPSCFIRLDISHFVKNLHRLNVFKNIDRRISKFFYAALA